MLVGGAEWKWIERSIATIDKSRLLAGSVEEGLSTCLLSDQPWPVASIIRWSMAHEIRIKNKHDQLNGSIRFFLTLKFPTRTQRIRKNTGPHFVG